MVSTVGTLFQLNPSGYQVTACPVVSCTGSSLHKHAANQNTLLIEGILHTADGADTGVHSIGHRIKVVIVFTHSLPTGF